MTAILLCLEFHVLLCCDISIFLKSLWFNLWQWVTVLTHYVWLHYCDMALNLCVFLRIVIPYDFCSFCIVQCLVFTQKFLFMKCSLYTHLPRFQASLIWRRRRFVCSWGRLVPNNQYCLVRTKSMFFSLVNRGW